ncbi:phosphate ABC transporter membrane protein 1, PhoT family [Rhizobiales bacterium GAS191]|nr:phosphate ABC transporter membrane protein 1, PhoT family [Rhizobiales bacterium GAS113]SED47410.1 phosphate ABC transporter membrane protein 1, PhoT family [Rhizobiales bacterium GAS188]SEE92398.1 phosphate ABC transporter membrane protein 1, PhoT family [Rhizobiales bacterium GAS191]
MSLAADASRDHALKRFAASDALFRLVTRSSAYLVLALLGGVIITLIVGSWLALSNFGFSFFASQSWNPNPDILKFGALAPIYGTVVTSVIAMLIAVPVGLGVAVFLTELCPLRLRRLIGTAIELLAGVPSIIYGMWGLFVLAPVLQDFENDYLVPTLSHVPVLSTLFEGPSYGQGILTAGIILAIMVLPFIAAVTRDVFETVPPVLKEAAYGLGCTTREVVSKVVLPYSRVGVIGGGMLALGRALGETMAVTFVIGNDPKIRASILAPGATISSSIANEFAEAKDAMHSSALVALGLILFVITLIVLAAARFMLLRMNRRGGI